MSAARGFAIWFTGHSGSGKSAIARELLHLLHERGVELSLLESDVLRTQLTPFPRYDDADRDFFYGCVAGIGVSLVEQGRAVVFDATANRRAYRDAARNRLARFVEVYVDTPLEVCRARDPKGLYKKARAGQIPEFTGISAPYEAPLKAELTITNTKQSAEESLAEMISYLERQGYLSA